MSKNYDTDGLFVDTGLLRDHVSKLHERKKTATRLYESVRSMRRADDPAFAYKYDSILQNIEQLIEYFTRMASALDKIEGDATELSQKIGRLIEEDTDDTRHTISNNFML